MFFRAEVKKPYGSEGGTTVPAILFWLQKMQSFLQARWGIKRGIDACFMLKYP